jgi:hypothetical protein
LRCAACGAQRQNDGGDSRKPSIHDSRPLPENESEINAAECEAAVLPYQTAAMMQLTVIEVSYSSRIAFLTHSHR